MRIPKLSIDEDLLLSMLGELVALDTSFPPGDNYAQFVSLLEKVTAPLNGVGSCVDVPETLWAAPGVHGKRTNLIIHPDVGAEGTKKVTIYFHVDTAPVGDGWTRPPLRMTREGNKIFARGAADMKGAIAAAVAGLQALIAQGHKFAFQPVLAFCTDEEGGKYPGIRYLADTDLVSDTIINLNGSATPRIWAGCFGSLDFSIALEGKAAHSGQPHLGLNAIENALPVLNAIAKLKKHVESRVSTLPAPPGANGPLHALLNVTAIHSGQKGSAIPGHCQLVVNRRYAPEEDVAKVRAEICECIEAAVSNSKLLGCQIEEVGHLPPVENSHGILEPRWTAALAEGHHVPIEEFVAFGSTTSSDFGWIQQDGKDGREIMLGGLSRPDRNVHAADEFTTIEDLLGLARAVALFFSAEFSLPKSA